MFTKLIDYIRRDIPYGIKNIIRWFPIIWKDRNWDHIFIYKILRHKLYFQQKHIREHNIHTSAIKDADRMKTCVFLLNRLIDDDYYDIAIKPHNQKWGEGEMKFTECKEDPSLHKFNIIYENVHTEQDEIEERKDFKKVIEHEKYLREQDKELLFNMMKKYIEGWWD